MNIFTRPNILTQPLWRDEAFSVLLSERSLLEIIKITAQDFSPPFYYLVLSGWMSLLGNSEVALRSLSLLFFVGAVFFVYLLGRNLFKERVARLAALLALLNPFLFYYAFEARMYTLFTFLVAGSFYFLVSKRWALFVLFSLIGLYTHTFMVVALVGELAAFFLLNLRRKKSKPSKLFLGLGGLGLSYVPWLLVLMRQLRSAKKSFWVGNPSWGDLFGFFTEIVVDGVFVSAWLRSALGVLLFSAAVFILGWYFRNYVRKSETVLGLLGGFVLLPVLGTFAVSKTAIPVLVPRYLIFVVVPFALVLAFLLDKIPFRRVFLGLALILFVCLNFKIWNNPQKRDLRQPIKEVSRWWQGEPLICETILDFFQVKYYGQRYLGNNAEVVLLEKGYAAYAGGALVEEGDLLTKVPPSSYFFVVEDNGVKWCRGEGCKWVSEL